MVDIIILYFKSSQQLIPCFASFCLNLLEAPAAHFAQVDKRLLC